MFEEKVRKALTDRALAANPPFLHGEDAFYVVNSAYQPTRVLAIVEVEYLPERRQVASTGLFAFSALAIGSVLGGERLNPSLKYSELQGFPSDLFSGATGKKKDEGVAGYSRLVKYAMSLLTQIRSNLFLNLATDMAGCERKGGMLLRIGPLTPNDHVTLGSLLESGSLDVAVGLDTTQPDVGEQDIFVEISSLPELKQQSDYGFRCMSDQQITALLREKERTGLFWRYGGRVPAGSAYSVGSCYARLGEKRFSPVRLDVVARTEELGKRASDVVSYLANTQDTPLIAPGSAILINLSDVLGGDSVAIPLLAEKLLRELYEKRHSPDSEFHKFYRDRETKLL